VHGCSYARNATKQHLAISQGKSVNAKAAQPNPADNNDD